MTTERAGLKPLPCPFCGEHPTGPFDQKYPDAVMFAIQCKCGVNVCGYPSKPLALRAWNLRTPAPPRLDQAVEGKS